MTSLFVASLYLIYIFSGSIHFNIIHLQSKVVLLTYYWCRLIEYFCFNSKVLTKKNKGYLLLVLLSAYNIS